MGNTPSKGSGSTPQSPASHVTAHINNVRREPRRRESIQALSNVKATAAPPSASLESATAHSTTRSSAHSHARSRSQTIPTQYLRPHNSTDPSLSPGVPATPANSVHMGNQSSSERTPERPPNEAPAPSPATQPVAVPGIPLESHHQPEPLPDDVPGTPQGLAESYHAPPSQFSRPPRLPLPIEEELHTPGSPIISPGDLTAPVEPIEADGSLPRRTSVLSSTTADEDDAVEDYHIEGDGRPTVPTLIEWRGGGEKVYITGTFVKWDKKFRLHRDGPSKHKDALSAYINLAPGTHHLKFIVDGDMKLSDSLPTAVDFTNFLVNYIEVSPDDIPQAAPGHAAATAGKQGETQPRHERAVPSGVYSPHRLPQTPEAKPTTEPAKQAPYAEQETLNEATPLVPGPAKQYHQDIPKWLLDYDAPEESSRYHRASQVVATTPAPPTLPMFLTKSILNSATPMKDDASVLVFPNHTVLNHLATTSIKSHVLATSATTRYKRKFLTTIMYKPTSDNGD